MPKSLHTIAAEMDQFIHDLDGPTQDLELDLLRIFLEAERALYLQRDSILVQLNTDTNGKLVNSNENLARIDALIRQVDGTLNSVLINPGFGWTDSMALFAHESGRALAGINLSMSAIDQAVVRATFAHVTLAEEIALRSAAGGSYAAVNAVAKDIGDFIRRELTNAVIHGLPTIGPGSLAERLFRSGRLQPLKIVGKDGRIITRTVEQRAVAIARVESARIANAVQNEKTIEVLGDFAVYKNINPEDDRTTAVCMAASKQLPMSMEAWLASEWGIPPRLVPDFHLCRSVLFGGTVAMFQEAGYEVAAEQQSYAMAAD